ncbi:MAG: hypothetical protein IT210_14210 [Armatimonadetes bacterium]|nr:hypothetical protein [Armatimonadota bacterium]
MATLLWDEFEVSEFFLHDAAPIKLIGDANNGEGCLFHARDERLTAEVIVLPAMSLLCVNLRDSARGHIVTATSVYARTELSVRHADWRHYLYCHEYNVMPGFYGYRKSGWHDAF